MELQSGVQFHKGYGEMTSADVVWSFLDLMEEGSKHTAFNSIKRRLQEEFHRSR